MLPLHLAKFRSGLSPRFHPTGPVCVPGMLRPPSHPLQISHLEEFTFSFPPFSWFFFIIFPPLGWHLPKSRDVPPSPGREPLAPSAFGSADLFSLFFNSLDFFFFLIFNFLLFLLLFSLLFYIYIFIAFRHRIPAPSARHRQN